MGLVPVRTVGGRVMEHPERIPPICFRYPLTVERVEATEHQIRAWTAQDSGIPGYANKFDAYLAGFIELWSHPAGGGQ